MAEYRAYAIDSDGHFVGFEPLGCTSDAEAIELAQRLLGFEAIEFGGRALGDPPPIVNLSSVLQIIVRYPTLGVDWLNHREDRGSHR